MNSDQIFNEVEAIASVSGKNAKQSIMEACITDPDFKRVMVACYDQMVTYGIAKKTMPDVAPGTGVFTSQTFNILDRLASRDLTGKAAQTALAGELAFLSPGSGELLKRIILKDMKAGFTEGTVNRAAPGTIVTFDCMLAHSFKKSKHKIVYPADAQPKLDGVRVLAFIDYHASSVRFLSRSGKEYFNFGHIAHELIKLLDAKFNVLLDPTQTNIVIEGEVISGSFNSTISDARSKTPTENESKFYVFDTVPASVFAGLPYAATQTERNAILASIVGAGTAYVKPIPTIGVNSHEDCYTVYEKFRGVKLEGAIIKNRAAHYQCDRSYDWQKMKAEESVDIPVTGWYYGDKGTKNETLLGGFYADFDGVQIGVGGGWSQVQREEYILNPDAQLGRLMKVEYHEVTEDGSLRHPRFKEWRDDKRVQDGPGC